MNRIIIIGNGFDLAHGLKTSYKDFIEWYWEKRIKRMQSRFEAQSKDELCEIKLENRVAQDFWISVDMNGREKGKAFIDKLSTNPYIRAQISMSNFVRAINSNIETKGWVDIENEYYAQLKQVVLDEDINESAKRGLVYKLDRELTTLKDLLLEYLSEQNSVQVGTIDSIWKKIYAPIDRDDIAVADTDKFWVYVQTMIGAKKAEWDQIFDMYQLGGKFNEDLVIEATAKLDKMDYETKQEFLQSQEKVLECLTYPENILLLSFNYTNVARKYHIEKDRFKCRYIHGELADPEHVIFGYGDELETDYKAIREKNENVFLKNMKSIRYLEMSNYRDVLRYLERAPYQVFIMGHSCGNSDRTLLNTIFEHKNCVSIKPFYYVKPDGTDNYMEIVQNISRNFEDMKLMRDRVVNKTFCETLV